MNYIRDLHDYSPPATEEAKRFLSEGRMHGIKREIEAIVDDEFERLQEYADEYISSVAADRAKRFLDKVLSGDKNAAMALLGSPDDSDRYRSSGHDAGRPWAEVHNGAHVFETNGIRLRREIVESHADLIRDERIKDLESIIDGLKQQISRLEHEREMSMRR